MQVTINGIDTRYVLSNEGGGPWLTFIHQLGGDLSIWDQLAGYFRDEYTVLRYDVRGHGATACPRQPFTIANTVATTSPSCSMRWASRKRIWSGMSMGGMIAQQFALDHPSRIETLTLADTASGTAPENRAAWDQRAAKAAQRRHGLAIVAATLGRWLDTGLSARRIPRPSNR